MEHHQSEICRMCLENTPNLTSFFKKDPQHNNLLLIVRETVRLDISIDDNLPKMICESCAVKLQTIEDYVKIFRESDRKLRNTVIELKPKDDSNDSIDVKDNNMQNNWRKNVSICTSTGIEETHSNSNENHNDPIDEIYVQATDESQADQKPSSVAKPNSPVRRSQRFRIKYKSKLNDSSSSAFDQQSDEDFQPPDEDEDQTFIPENEKIKEEIPTANEKPRRRKPQKRKQIKEKKDDHTKTQKLVNLPSLHDFKCYICTSEPLGTRKALIEHLATHVDKIPYTCEKCVMESVVLTRVRTLNTHMKMHEQPIKCDYCDRRYSNAAGKYYHTQTYHLGGGAPCLVSCDICGKQCGSQVALKQHMKYHTTTLKCSKCDMVFNHANKRRNHELTHNEHRGYECIVCKKVLQTIESYDVHLKKHSQERSYPCSLCPKKFNTSFNLILHLKVHAKNYNYRPAKSWVEHYTILSRNPMQYKCNHCDRYGTDKVNNMISHLQAHFKEHKCDRCNRLFATAKQLRAHLTTYTGEKPEMCQHCGKCFSTKNSLRIHLKTHARDESVAETNSSVQLVVKDES
ncbi:zinc finger protein 569-like [Anopheles coustani]|uniref:zinc finger protein 569-like n=1 Tax=Anopheles coustani TaxID=139045 RepID=UPI002658A965|nr:zinc finger protein 569-like [Anopheles coustani]